jgi:lysophospholipase L1-like esterase
VWLCLAAVAALLLVELGLGLAWPQVFPTQAPGMYRPDPELGHVPTPDFDGQFTRGEFSVRVRTNVFGLRGPALPPRRPDTLRILGLGDSTAWGWGVEEAEAWTPRLEALLRARHPSRDVQVLNGAVPQYGLEEERVFLRRHGASLDPDFVILQFYAGDDFEQTRRPARERHEFRDGQLVQAAEYTRSIGPFWWQVHYWLKHRSHLVHLLSERTGTWLMRTGVLSLSDLEHASSSWFTDEDAARVKALLGEIRALGGDLGAPLLVAFAPEKMQVLAGSAAARHAADFVGSATREAGASFVDLTPHLLAARDPAALYFAEEGHWRAGGHALVAEVLADEVERLGWLGRP